MDLTKDQIDLMKKQIISHIDSTFPPESKDEAIEKVNSMGDEAFIEFVKQNKLISQDSSQTKCIFCSIVFGDIPSYKIGENNASIGVLEINPISKGHIIIIPKNHVSSKEDIPREAYALVEELSGLIQGKLSPKKVLVEESQMFGHWIINLIPVYTNETLKSERKSADKEELEQLGKDLLVKEEVVLEEELPEETKELPEENLWLPKRVP